MEFGYELATQTIPNFIFLFGILFPKNGMFIEIKIE